jgi:uncharacterized protein
MKFEGDHRILARRRDVWSALHDPQVLSRALPGVRELEVTGPDRYALTIEFGVGAVRGVYRGHLALDDEHEFEACTVKANASGSPGSVDATAKIRLGDVNGDGTRLSYSADANVAGPVSGVGQRLITATVRRTTESFIEGLQRELAGTGRAAEDERAGGGEPGAIFAPGRAASPAKSGDFATGMVVGFVLALIGIGFGRWTAGRR